jgi:hypothetical protein
MLRADRLDAALLRLSLVALLALEGLVAPAVAQAAPGQIAATTSPNAAAPPVRATGRATATIIEPVSLRMEEGRAVLDQAHRHSTTERRGGSIIVHLE